jgi:hydrogenase maturation protease
MTTRPAFIVGIGNALRGDDGAGPAVVARLEHGDVPTGTSCLATHQLTPELAERLTGVSVAVFVDAAVDVAPGEVKTTRLDTAGGRLAVPAGHFVDPQGLLAIAKTVYGAEPEAWIVAIGGESFGYEERLSDAAVRGIDLAVKEVTRLVGMGPPA